MMVTEVIEINQSKDAVWKAISDIENCERIITSILKVNILNKPASGIVGLKWEETREMFGKEASETIWITDSETNEYYSTRAESHGSVYITKLSLTADDNGTLLTMSFNGIPQSFIAKIVSFLMGPLIRNSIKKVLIKDLADIKAYVEKS